jgi:hypothetical protein
VHIGTSSCGMCDFRITLIVHGMEEKKISVWKYKNRIRSIINKM